MSICSITKNASLICETERQLTKGLFLNFLRQVSFFDFFHFRGSQAKLNYVICAPHQTRCISVAAVAQLVEPRIVIPVVVGSSPISRPTSPPFVNSFIFYFRFQDLVLSSIPFFNSKIRQLSAVSFEPNCVV